MPGGTRRLTSTIAINNVGTTTSVAPTPYNVLFPNHVFDVYLPGKEMMSFEVGLFYIRLVSSGGDPLQMRMNLGTKYNLETAAPYSTVSNSIECIGDFFIGTVNEVTGNWLRGDFGGAVIDITESGRLFMHLEWISGSNSRLDVGGTTHTSFYYENGILKTGMTSFYMILETPVPLFEGAGDGCWATGEWLYSKNHPNIYENNLECLYATTQDVAITAHRNGEPDFDTEPGYDYVRLAHSERVFLGKDGPVNEPLLKNETVYFFTDSSNNLYNGFAITRNEYPCKRVGDCFYSPNYLSNASYVNDAFCTFALEGYGILTTTAFGLEDGLDYLRHSIDAGTTVVNYTGTSGPSGVIFSSGDTLEFSSDA